METEKRMVVEILDEDGKAAAFSLTSDEGKRLKQLLQKRSGIQKPRVTREGSRIIIETGVEEFCSWNKGTPNEILVKQCFQRAGSHHTNAYGEVEPESVIPALMIAERWEHDPKWESARYCYQDGKPVDRREDLEFLPREHRPAALEWFDQKYGAQEVENEETEEVQSPEQEPEAGPDPESPEQLSLMDRVVVGISQNLSGKSLAKTLGVSEGTISTYRKKAMKEGVLDRSGCKLTPLGAVKYGRASQMRLNKFSRGGV